MLEYFHYSFVSGVETKSGRLIKPPGKFATCVSGQRKNSKLRYNKQGDTLNSTFTSSILSEATESDLDTTSLIVNTSEMDETDFNETIPDDITQFTTFENTEDIE